METYTVTVATGTSEYSGTNNYIFVTLLGEHGESERTLLDNPGLDFCRGAVCVQPPSVYLCRNTERLLCLSTANRWISTR